MSAFRALSTEQRRTLRAALASGALATPFTTLGVGRVVGTRHGTAVAAELSRLAALGMQPPHIAEVVAAVDGAAAATVELVWSGPDEGPTETRDTGVVARELFAGAKRSVVLTGFALYQGKRILAPLAERMDAVPDLQVRMFLNVERKYRDTTATSIVLREFRDRFLAKEWPGQRRPEIFYDPRTLELHERGKKRAALHAKCIVVDGERVLVTSANLTEAAQERNVEIGVLLEDVATASAIVRQLDALVARGTLQFLALG